MPKVGQTVVPPAKPHETHGHAPTPTPSKDGKDYKKLFKLFGVGFSANGSTQVHAEECPFCGGGKFYLDAQTGRYKCHSEGSCGESGNAYTFIRWVHKACLNSTTDDHYRRLKSERGLPLQTLKRHELAWCGLADCWLIPYKAANGAVMTLGRYYPKSGFKPAVPCLPLQLYGLDQLSPDPEREIIWCEGPWDAIALDHHLKEKKTRKRYDILAVPSANVFRPEWLKHLKGRVNRLCFDNDDAGRDGQERIAKMVREEKVVCKLSALKWPEGSPPKCDVRDLIQDGVSVVEFTSVNCVTVSLERRILFHRGDRILPQTTEWLWEFHIPFGTFASLSGRMGTHKSDIAKDLTARVTAGRPMPDGSASAGAASVMYFTSEDSESQVRDLVELHGGDLTRLHVHDIAHDGDEPLDVLDYLGEMEAEVKALGVRLVVIDALNSFVGGDISSDSKARRTLSGRLQALARRTGACIIGLRNWGRLEVGTASQKALGATSLSDVARCVMNTLELQPAGGKDNTCTPPPADLRWQLEFEKVSGTLPARPEGYRIEDLHTCKEDAHLRKIVWEKEDPQFAALRAKKGSKKG